MILSGDEFERHAETSVHFFSKRVPLRLAHALTTLGAGDSLIDVGCGDGQLVWSLMNSGVLPKGVQVTGVDVSPTRVRRFEALTGQRAILADGGDLGVIPDASFSFCVSTMVMEHVGDDLSYARALARIVKPNGHLFLTTVLRLRGAWYFRKAPDGRRVLDPTHEREYASADEVIKKLESAGFRVVQSTLEPLVFPLVVPFIRWFNAVRPIKDVQRIFLRQPWSSLERVGLHIPRYREIQLVLQRVPGPRDLRLGAA